MFIAGCGGILTELTGYIESPNYPNKYRNNENCYWFIKVSTISHLPWRLLMNKESI